MHKKDIKLVLLLMIIAFMGFVPPASAKKLSDISIECLTIHTDLNFEMNTGFQHQDGIRYKRWEGRDMICYKWQNRAQTEILKLKNYDVSSITKLNAFKSLYKALIKAFQAGYPHSPILEATIIKDYRI